jgi:divalent metal cation (Fe/Co/Zn/Cd) transporter
MLDAIQGLVSKDRDVTGFRRPDTMYLGPQVVLLNMDVEFADHLTAIGIESAIDRIECNIRARFPEVKRIFIESEWIVRRKQPLSPAGPQEVWPVA